MLLFTRESRRWRWITLLAAVILLGVYWRFAGEGYAHGGSSMGLLLGALALLLTLVLLFLGVRKRWHKFRVGTLQTWTQSHLYLGLFVLLAALLHTGFRFEDRVAVAALVAMIAVVVTGVIGAVLYSVVPFLLTGVETSLSLDEASEEINQLTRSMSRLASGRSPQLQELTRQLLAPARPGPLAGWRLILGASHRGREDESWSERLPDLPPADEQALRQILVLRRQYRELQQSFVAQQRYRNLLALWLYLHVPLCAALMLLLLAHLVGVAFFSDALDWVRSWRS
jgi:hypothetical protein